MMPAFTHPNMCKVCEAGHLNVAETFFYYTITFCMPKGAVVYVLKHLIAKQLGSLEGLK